MIYQWYSQKLQIQSGDWIKNQCYFNPYLQDTHNLQNYQRVNPGITKIYLCYSQIYK